MVFEVTLDPISRTIPFGGFPQRSPPPTARDVFEFLPAARHVVGAHAEPVFRRARYMGST